MNPIQIKGIIIDLDESNHKTSIKLLDQNNEEQIEKFSYINLIKKQQN